MPPVDKRVVYVMLPTGSREEARAATLALALEPDASLVMASAAAHTPGQRIPGDVVVVGRVPPGLERDADGRVYHAKDMASLGAVGGRMEGRRKPRQVPTEHAGETAAVPVQPRRPEPAEASEQAEE